MSYDNQSALVIGAGISGFAAARYLAAAGARVTLSDAKDEADAEKDALTQKHIEDLRTQGISCVFGAQREELLDGIDLIVLSPAVPERIPLVRAARARGIRVTTEVELAGEIARAPIYAITGTNGKTTTTTLLGELLAAILACRSSMWRRRSLRTVRSRLRSRAIRWRRRRIFIRLLLRS